MPDVPPTSKPALTAHAADESDWGLSDEEARARLERDGPNTLPTTPPPPAWRLFLFQVTHFFAILLWIAGLLAFVAQMPQLGWAIFTIILINGIFAFVQEHRADRAAQRLHQLLPRQALVIRGGRERLVDAADLVRGDLVVLAPGDRISADIELGSVHALSVEMSMLTGESVPTRPDSGDRVFAGTFVVEGEGRGTVIATGGKTRLAQIARLATGGRRPASPLARELSRVVRIIALIAVAVGLSFFVVSVALGLPPAQGFLFAIGVTVALVPEGLLPTVTLSLAVGAQRMAGRKALVRRLESVQTLGSTTFICTDKTGTLTRNEMAVVETWTPSGSAEISPNGIDPSAKIALDEHLMPATQRLAGAAVLCSSGRLDRVDGRWQGRGDPMEVALDVLARRLGVDVSDQDSGAHVLARYPFDARRRRMSVLVSDQGLLTKGAPDAVLPLCGEIAGATEVLNEMAERGLRVLAVARRDAPPGEAWPSAAEAEQSLELLGLVGLEDPPRTGAAAAIQACRGAGIRVAMITGDHPGTALAIAREVGLVAGQPLVIQGTELPVDDAELGRLLDHDGVIVSRVDPEDKLRIARALRVRGHVVAMTGDGVNDGPALREADIGIAMGLSGTDVAREASDLVLLDDDFATIVAAIEQGRSTFANIRRFLTYHLVDNVAELAPFAVWALSAGTVPLALGVLQVLLLDVGTDQLPALGLGVEPPGRDTLHQRPSRGHLLDPDLLRRAFLVLGPVEAFMEMLAFATVLLAGGWWPGQPLDTGLLLAASGTAFAAVVIGQAAAAIACRDTRRWAGAARLTSNPLLLAGVVAELGLLLVLLYVDPIAAVVGHAGPSPLGWAMALLAAPAVVLADTVHKRMRAV
ncbi:MAG: cation-transporting P-type ATPase [Chloroflexota bacterium]